MKIIILSTIAFIAILLTTRFDEIAHFACLGGSWLELLQFMALQLPYLLPIALPISALLSVMILFRRLSQKHELTAMRASGISLGRIIAPILLAAAFLSVLNFYFVSEVAPAAHLSNSLLKHKLRTINPLFLLQNKRLLQMHGVFCETYGAAKPGEYAEKVVFGMPEKKHQRISLLLAGSLRGEEESIRGENLTFVSSLGSEENIFDPLYVENVAMLDTPVKAFTPAMQQKIWTVQPDHLQLSLLLAHKDAMKDNKKQSARAVSEIVRRSMLAFSIFSFTLLGMALGMELGRHTYRWRIPLAALVTGFFLLTYFAGKGLEDKWVIASLLYIVPHVVMVGIATWLIYRINMGKE